MRTARFFVPPEWIAWSAEAFSIPAGPIHHQMIMVLRLKVGDHVSLCPNNGTELDCVITEITRSVLLGSVVSKQSAELLGPEIVMCAAITKRQTFEWMLQKCTELGVSEFFPLVTERVVKKIDTVPPRWQEIVREASEQSGRMYLPVIHEPLSLSAALVKTASYNRYMFHEAVGMPGAWPNIRCVDRIALFIGPEGGWTNAEVLRGREAKNTIIQLGTSVLRAETAAVVGVGLFRFTARH